jgi:hypothetical protein
MELASGANGTSAVVMADAFSLANSAGTSLLSVGTVNGVSALGFNGSAIFDGSVTAKSLSVTTLSAISSQLGSVTIGTGGYLASGQTAWNTGTGFWLEYNAGTPRFSIGNGTYGMTWDGTNLALKTPIASAGFDVVPYVQSFGYGQVYSQFAAPARTPGVTYYNTGNKVRSISVLYQIADSTYVPVTLVIQGITSSLLPEAYDSSGSVVAAAGTLFGVVPVGGSYYVSDGANGANIINWVEFS